MTARDSTEEWRTVCDGFYEVSSQGVVRRLRPGRKTWPGKVIRPVAAGKGYLALAGCNDGKTFRVYIHRLVALAFIGPCPEGHEVNHKNGNKRDNSVSNLEYVTRSQNMRHAVGTGLVRPRAMAIYPKPPRKIRRGADHWMRSKPERIARGARQGSAKLTDAIVLSIRARVAAGETQRTVAADTGISAATVCNVCKRKTWRHLP